MTIKENLTQQTKAAAAAIRAIKERASRMEEREVLVYVDEDGAEYREWAKGRKLKAVKRMIQAASINPDHPKWGEYLALKRQASILLTEKAIARAFDYDPDQLAELTKDQVKSMVQAGLLKNHARRPSRIAYAALRRVRSLAKAFRAAGMAVAS